MSEVLIWNRQSQIKLRNPAGLVPKNLQAFLLVGLALLMVLIMAITGHKRPVSSVPKQHRLCRASCRSTRTRSQIFKKALNRRNLNPHRRLRKHCSKSRSNWRHRGWDGPPFPPNLYGNPVTSANFNGAYPPGAYAAAIPQPAEEQPLADPIKDEQKKRAYLSLFSDNVALTYRKELRGQDPARNSSAPITTAAPADLAVNQTNSLPTQERRLPVRGKC